jgi:stearoyl-CoA desaturase (delta-9 desaturase)
MEQTNKKKVNKKVAIFVITTPIVGVLSLIGLIYFHQLYLKTVIFGLAYLFIGALSITAGYHRLFSHRAYKANAVVRFLMAVIGSSQFEGSVLEWSTDHRNHHRYSETEKDPYSITKGFWHAHMGWLIYLDTSKRDFSNVEDLAADPIIMWSHKHFLKLAIFMGFIFPMAFCGLLWGDWLGGLLIAGALRIAINQQTTFCINSICHMFGSQKYSEEQTARDNWVTALITTGEGYHNYHHQFPLDYRNGIKWYHYDPAKWLIKALHLCGLAKDLRVQSPQKIIQYKIKAQETGWIEKWSKKASALPAHLEELIAPMKTSIMEQLKKMDDYDKQIKSLKLTIRKASQEQVEQLKELITEKHQELLIYKKQLHVTRQELKQQLKDWRALLKMNPKVIAHKA